jgi:hypothetical protein
MDRQELFIDNNIVELSDDVAVALNFLIADIAEPENRKADYSKTINLPGSEKINKLFSHIYNVNIDLTHSSASFNPNIRVSASYAINSVELIDGYLQLKKVNIKDGCISYEVNIFGRNANLFNDIGEALLNELDISTFNHNWTMDNEVLSWGTSIVEGGVAVPFELGKGYVYPMIDYGFDNSEDEFAVSHLFPAVYAKEYIDRIFAAAGYTYNSTFFDSNYFKSLIIPYNGKDLRLTSTQVEDRKVIVQNTIQNQRIYTTASTPPITIKYPFNAPAIQDNSTQFNFTTDEATIAQDGYYNLIAEMNYNAEFIVGASGLGITVDSLFAINAQIQLVVERGGVPTVENVKDIWIYPDGSFVNTYTTAINPTPLSNEYWDETTTGAFLGSGVYVTVLSSKNSYNPASISICNLEQIFLQTGDVVYVNLFYQLAPVDFQFALSSGTEFFKQTGSSPPVFYNGTINFNINASDFRIIPATPTLVEGNPIEMNVAIPKTIKQREFLKSIINMHNLYIQPQRENPKVLDIEPRDDFYTTDVVDWSSKLDTLNDILIEPLGALKFRDFEFSYKADKDYYNALYEDTYDEVYGYRRIILDNEFLKGSKKVELSFSPTPLIGSSTSDRIISEIFKTDNANNKVTLEHNPRILYYNFVATSNNSWAHTSDIVATVNRVGYPFAGNLDDAYNPTIDLNFGLSKEVYYDDSFATVNGTIAGLVNRYYFNYINEISNENSKIVTAYFNLNAVDINELSFKKQYYFNGSYYRLQQVVDYNPVDRQLTKCVFIKLADIVDFVDVPFVLNGGNATITGGADSEPSPSTDATFKDNNTR